MRVTYLAFWAVSYDIYRVFQKMWTSLEKSSWDLKSGKSTEYIWLDRKNQNLDFDTSSV